MGGSERAAPVAAGTALFVASVGWAELAYWDLMGGRQDVAVIIAASCGLAVGCAALARLAGSVLPPLLSAAIGAAAGVFPLAFNLTTAALGLDRTAWVVAAAAVAASGTGLAAGWLLQRRVTFPVLAVLAVLFLAPLARHPLSDALGRGSPETPTDRPDIILIVMDTTRPDHLTPYGYGLDTTPHLQRFSQLAAVYDNAWSVAPWTSSSHASMLTALLPAEHGVEGSVQPAFPELIPTLPELLRSMGYRTGAFLANPNLHAPGWDRGFQAFRPPWFDGRHTLIQAANRILLGSGGGWRISGTSDVVFRQARRWWSRNAGAPRFLLVNLLDPHRPYGPSEDDYARFLPDTPMAQAAAVDQDPLTYHARPGVRAAQATMLRGLYDGELARMDRAIGSFLDWLGEREELDSSLIVVTADHGERLGERGLVGHALDVDDTLLRVPLMIRHPPKVEPGRVERIVQLDGVAGYLLHLIDAEDRAPAVMRQRALHTRRLDVAVGQRQENVPHLDRLERQGANAASFAGDHMMATDGRFAYVESRSATRVRRRLIDLQLDPDWLRDVTGEHPDVERRLRAYLEDLPLFADARERKLDVATQRRLRALGYVD